MLPHKMIKVVIDTNILVDALTAMKSKHSDDPNYILIRLIENNQIILEVNDEIVREYDRVLNKLQMSQKVFDPMQLSKTMRMIREKAQHGPNLRRQVILTVDPGDQKFFKSINVLSADYLVTRDTTHFNKTIQDELKEIGKKLKILTAKQLAARLK